MVQFMEMALKRVLKWGNENGLIFNPEKTTVVMFKKSRAVEQEPPIKIGGTKLAYS